MKKWLVIFLLIFLITGCNQTEEVSNHNSLENEETKKSQEMQHDSDEQEQFMEKPKIIFSAGHSYRQGDGWLGESKEIAGDSVRALGRSMFLEIIFNEDIDCESAKEKIELIGYEDFEIEKHYNKENALRIAAREIENGKTYKLYIPKSIEDIHGNNLEEDIEIDLVLEEEPKAFYTFIGQEKTIADLGEITDDFGNVHFSLPVTNKTINFIVDFTIKVDKESVEDSIRKSLNNEGKINFEWINHKKLKLSLENLPVNKEYLISMIEATDESNMNIIGSLFFTLLEPSQLGFINLQTGENKLLKEFIDMPYMILPGDNYEQYFIADDAKKKYLLDIRQGSMVELPDFRYTFGYPQYEWYSNWLNSYTVLAFETDTNSIYALNLKNGEKQILFNIPPDIIKYEVYDIKLSPKKEKVAITNSSNNMDLHIFSLKGETLYKGERIVNTYTRNNGTNSMYLQWLNENTIIFQDKRDIVKLDISTGTKEILIKDAQEPITCPNSSLVLVRKSGENEYGAYLYNIAEDKGFIIGLEINNFIFISENELLYNEGQDIVLFDISQNTNEVIGKGKIIGVSPGKEKVYYLNNYYNVYDSYFLE